MCHRVLQLLLAQCAWYFACSHVVLADLNSRPETQSTRTIVEINNSWKLTADGQTTDVTVPGTFEEQIRPSFDGVGTYTVEIKPLSLPDGHRLFVHFDGVATKADVYFNNQPIGSHAGGWTPFRCDATQAARQSADGRWELRVEVDESVGHHTQGFLPIIAPHFGGIWQPVRLVVVPETHINDLQLFAVGDPATGLATFQVPVIGDNNDAMLSLTIELYDNARKTWRVIHRGQAMRAESPTTVSVPIDAAAGQSVRLWSPSSPHRYTARITIRAGDQTDVALVNFAFRTFGVSAAGFRINGQPVIVRGVLNWGYAPPRTAPTLDESSMRSEIELARAYGFNLMKFCLWVPPKRYLELCDELGMLAWVEYPTWHAQLSPANLPALRREYDEFFFYDRNHPSVVLRSLTCETGPSADLQVIQSLYDLAKERVPGAVVEDDSSWIQWNRVHDFYDDHPYGNNHTWPNTLARLTQHIAERTQKPLILGEAIAADTWSSPADFPDLARVAEGAEPFYWPIHARANVQWLSRWGVEDNRQFRDQSRRYAYLMRKYQIEAYRRIVPEGGYVVSVIRDFPLASMGLIDYRNEPKWSSDEWTFHGDTMLLLVSENDRRSFSADDRIDLPISVSHFGNRRLHHPRLEVALQLPEEFALSNGDQVQSPQQADLSPIDAGSMSPPTITHFDPLAVTRPTPVTVVATLTEGDQRWTNEWPIWVFPRSDHSRVAIVRHPTWEDDFLRNELDDYTATSSVDGLAAPILLARRFDKELLRALNEGARVLMLPDGGPASFPLEEHWFLRGGPVRFDRTDTPLALGSDWPIELQHFDLAGPVVPRIDALLSHITPQLLLWDNHDRPETKTHGLLFDLPVGRGHICVSALNHAGTTNAAGRWLLGQLLHRLAHVSIADGDPRGDRNAVRLRQELEHFELALQDRDWAFQPDPKNLGEQNGWHRATYDDSTWKKIQANRGWDGQGYESLDGWAWYRLRVTIPEELRRATEVYWSFTGVDDHYQAYVNGVRVGTGGDPATRKTAFEERRSHNITQFVKSLHADEHELVLAVAVEDWQGAGGIFRPVTLSSVPLSEDRPWLQRTANP